MPTWGELETEIQSLLAEGKANAFDIVRRRSIAALQSYTGRDVIFYGSAHLQKARVTPELISITREDLEGFMEVLYGLKSTSLDLVIHSPGGQPEAAAAIVKYLRSKFTNVRVIVPHEAMSAATMLACAADEIVMGRHSFLGPIDPQFLLATQLGVQSVPAQAILAQFDRAKEELLKDQRAVAVWLPLLQQYGPALLKQSENAIAFSQEIVTDWLKSWMFKNEVARDALAGAVAVALADHSKHKTHSRPLDREYLRSLKLQIVDLEQDQQLQERVLTVYHAAMHSFQSTGATKIIENHLGRTFVKMVLPSGPIPIVGPRPGAPRIPGTAEALA